MSHDKDMVGLAVKELDLPRHADHEFSRRHLGASRRNRVAAYVGNLLKISTTSLDAS